MDLWKPFFDYLCLLAHQDQIQETLIEDPDRSGWHSMLPLCSFNPSNPQITQQLLQHDHKVTFMSNEDFNKLKKELMWEGSSVVMLSTGSDEQRFLEASVVERFFFVDELTGFNSNLFKGAFGKNALLGFGLATYTLLRLGVVMC